jgi:DNA repair protein RecN (Recombination protein N)
MLQFLKINNFLLFKNQEISFNGNYTVITGETGSGKSMFIKALRFVLGEKQDLPLMDFSVTAEFKTNKESFALKEILEENDIELEDNIIILRRTLGSDNKGKMFINDVSVTLKLLRKVSEELVEFHSQHKQLDAFAQANSLNIIDQFMGDIDLLNQVSSLYSQITKVNNEIEESYKEKQILEQDKEFIEHSLKELKALNPREGEELELIEKKKLFSDKVKIISAIEGLLGLFERDEGMINKLVRSQRNLAKIESNIGLDELIENAIFHLSELQNQAENRLKDFDFYESMEDIEERLSKIKELSRKYRCVADQLPNIANDYNQRIIKLENIDQYIANKNKEKDTLLKDYFMFAGQLSKKRKIAAKELEEKIIFELKQLMLEQVELNIELESNQLRPIGSKGIDQSRFMIKTNKGFDFAPINEIASGGELSRIMLAFKVALAKLNQKTTIIFDEIDSGTGGAVAETIGNRMKELAQSNQIIAISHQPQVASKADQHLLVEKSNGAITKTEIKTLSIEEKIQEIARMLAGINISDSAILAAKSLMGL